MPDEKERKGVTQGEVPRADGTDAAPVEPSRRERRDPGRSAREAAKADTPVAGTRMSSSPEAPQDRQRDS